MKLATGIGVSVGLFAVLVYIFIMGDVITPIALAVPAPLRTVLWEWRALDLVGQILIILGGAFGVLVLTKERIET